MPKNAFLCAETTEKTAYRRSKTHPAAAVPQLEPHKSSWHCPKGMQGQPGPEQQIAHVSPLVDSQVWGQDLVPVLGRLIQDRNVPDADSEKKQPPTLLQKVLWNFPSSISGERDQVIPMVHGLHFIPGLWQRASLVHLNIQSVPQVTKNASMSL